VSVLVVVTNLHVFWTIHLIQRLSSQTLFRIHSFFQTVLL